jgi:hypothetical protein
MGKFSRTSPAKVADAVRRAKALELRLAGRTFDEIAAELDYADRTTAYRAVERALTGLGRHDAEQLRDLDLARLERLFAAVWPAASAGELDAVDRALKIIERRGRILGYERPSLVHIDTDTTHIAAPVDNPIGPVETLRDVFTQAPQETVFEIARVLHRTLPTNVNRNGEGGDDATHQTITGNPDQALS